MSAIDSGALQQHGLGFKLPTSPPRARAHVLASSLIEEDAASKAQRVARTGMVLLLQGLLVGGLLLIPFVVTEAIDLHQLNKTLLIAPAPPSAPPVARAQAI